MSKVIVVVEGGLVKTVLTDDQAMNLVVLDLDDDSERRIAIIDSIEPIVFESGKSDLAYHYEVAKEQQDRFDKRVINYLKRKGF